ncbi:LacI family DNA-binding transcriptional regulator [Methylobacterium terricola]|nr:LacI family DNA-binding transcriptional regulator [Methylobacterium terricola]
MPTIAGVADLAGVSRATVSRAFTRPEMLSEETVRRVKEVADEIGYRPNRAARALSTGQHGNIALIVPDIANPFFPPLIRAVQARADEAGLSVFLGDSDEDPAREDRLIGRFMPQVDGFVLACPRLSQAAIQAHARHRPIVLINRDIAGLSRILIDSARGVVAAMRHLHGLGHRRIAYLGGPDVSWAQQQRDLAVRQSASELGASIETLSLPRATFEAGFASADAIVASQATAAIAFDDLVAEGLLIQLTERGIPVPDAFSIIGCDDALGPRTRPALTTISSPAREAGLESVEALMENLQYPARRSSRRMMETALILRGSTAAAPS